MNQHLFKAKNGIRQAGFTLFELAIVACVVGIMATILFNRLQFYQKIAEKTAMEQTAGVIRSALHLQFASLAVRNRLDDTKYLVGQNPMRWLAEKPTNYAGEYFGMAAAASVVSGQWYFDLQDRNLVYLVHNHGQSKDSAQERPQVRFKITLVLSVGDTPVLGDAVDGKSIEGVVLEQTRPYAWN